MTRIDYALAKLAALITAAFLLLAGPLTLMFLGGVFSVDGFTKSGPSWATSAASRSRRLRVRVRRTVAL